MLFSIFTTSGYSFEGIAPDEKTLLFLQRHWFVLISRMFFMAILFFIPFVVYGVLYSYISAEYVGLFLFISVLYFLFWWGALFYLYTMYLLDMWLVTDHRVIDKRQFGFFNHSVAEIKLSRVQDISIHVSGIIPTFLNFGNLEVQSAGEERKFLFEQIPDPTSVKDEIMRICAMHGREEHPNNIESHNSADV